MLTTINFGNMTPTYIDFDGTEATVTGNLVDGAVLSDLSWAWNSSVACFPANQQDHFTGNHVLFYFDLPSYTEVEIDLIPDDSDADFSLYAYEVAKVEESNIVPNLARCIRCEADHKRDFKIRGQVQDHTRKVKDILAIKNPYQVVIGVAGAGGLTEGGFTLKITKVN